MAIIWAIEHRIRENKRTRKPGKWIYCWSCNTEEWANNWVKTATADNIYRFRPYDFRTFPVDVGDKKTTPCNDPRK